MPSLRCRHERQSTSTRALRATAARSGVRKVPSRIDAIRALYLDVEPTRSDIAHLLTQVDRLTVERDEAVANADAFLAHCFRPEARVAELTEGGAA